MLWRWRSTQPKAAQPVLRLPSEGPFLLPCSVTRGSPHPLLRPLLRLHPNCRMTRVTGWASCLSLLERLWRARSCCWTTALSTIGRATAGSDRGARHLL